MGRVVLARIVQIESLGIHVVELNRPELPGPTNRIQDVEVDLGTIKGAVTRLELVGHPRRIDRVAERRLGFIPHLVRADPDRGTCREVELGLETECPIVVENELDEERDLVPDLIRAQEDMTVVLLELTD